ncbi:MAG: endonuclease/exonuclease/phosphatase family protein [Candidatus Levybacteria bacterium]|nr:endonuclease/exonuclease/phosphatase family protein [Candidatus Levybacteria bacterium]
MEKTLSVLSFNVYGTPFVPHKLLKTLMRNNIRKRFRLIAKEINLLSPDVVLLQEVHDYFHLHYMMKFLSEYPHSFYRHSYFGPRGGLVIISKHQLGQKHYIDFHTRGKYFDKSITGHLSGKGVLLARIKSTDVYLLNTHLTQNSLHNWDVESNYVRILKSQLIQLGQLVNTFTTRKKSLILAGDFNMPKNSVYYHEFLQETKLLDSFKNDSFTTYHQSFLPKGASVGRLDFIFSTSSLKTTKTAYFLKKPVIIDEKEWYLSDHIGLYCIFKFEKLLQ